jgi:hypothetical protein
MSAYEKLGTTVFSACAGVLFTLAASSASAQQQADACAVPAALEPGAFDAPMTFSWATSKGNSNTSAWIAATGVIQPDTPARFREFLNDDGGSWGGSQLVLHSPGGNLSAGLELGRLFRKAGLTAHIGRTERTHESYNTPCDSWYDGVEPGICASSCAYAFLGGEVRFVESPYYPTNDASLGFHQFYGGGEDNSDLVTAEQAAQIRSSTLSVAQAITGQILMYAVEMGIDPRVVAFASSTQSNDLYFPTADEIDELNIASGSGLAAWFMEPYSTGLVTAAKPRRSDSMLEQITMYCLNDRKPMMMIIMDLRTPSYPNPDDLPLDAVEVVIDGQLHKITRRNLDVRYNGDMILIRASMIGLSDRFSSATQVEFSLDAPRVMGNFREESALDEAARQSIALAWRNCI